MKDQFKLLSEPEWWWKKPSRVSEVVGLCLAYCVCGYARI